jgi:hypothetical protein
VICSPVFVAPWVVSSGGPVEPVELRGIWRGQVELQRGTGGTRVSPGSLWANMVPPVTPAGSTRINIESLQYHRFHQFPADSLARKTRVSATDLESIL